MSGPKVNNSTIDSQMILKNTYKILVRYLD